MKPEFQFNDGGRAAAGYKGMTGDCVTRAVAIAAELPYDQVYRALAEGNERQRKSKHHRTATGHKTARAGINVTRKWFKDYMTGLGFRWTACMGIGTGCKVHLRADQLPAGRIVASLSKHWCAVIDGVVHDTYDGSRDGTRCVYGYWTAAKSGP